MAILLFVLDALFIIPIYFFNAHERGNEMALAAQQLTETAFFILNRLAAAGDGWTKITKTAPYLMTSLQTAGLVEINFYRTHARITEAGRQVHKDARVLRGQGEPLPVEVSDIRKWRYLR
jgi:hypothetical protein